MEKKTITAAILLLTLLISLTACSSDAAIQPTSIVNSPTRTLTQTITHTPIPPTYTPTLTPTLTDTPLPTATSSHTPTATPSSTPTGTPSLTPTKVYGFIPENAIIFYLTHIGTGGPVACGDSLVAVMTGHIRTGDIEKDIKLAVDTLFSIGQYSGYLYNATYPSSLRVGGVYMEKTNAIVELGGTYVRPNDACDASRYRAQVWSTIRQFPEVDRAIPKVKGALLGDLLAVFSDSGK